MPDLINIRLTKDSPEIEAINYTYDIDGKLLSANDKNGTITYSYDIMDGLTR